MVNKVSAQYPLVSLNELLILNQSGIWGKDGNHEDFPVLRSSNIHDNRLVLDDVAYRKVNIDDAKEFMLEKGDIIVTKSSGSPNLVGKCCRFNLKSDKPYLFSNFVQRLRVNPEKVNSDYLFYYLISPLSKAVLRKINNTTSGLRNLNMRDYGQQMIPALPLPTQRHIASILEKAESTREKRKEANRLTNEFLKSAFLEVFGDPMKNPKKWEIGKIGENCLVESGGTPSTEKKEYWEHGKIPWVGSTVCKDNFVEEAKQFITEEGLENSSSKVFKKKTTLIALVGATIGKTGFLTFDSATNQNIAGLYPNNKNLLIPEYIFFSAQYMYPKFLALSRSGFKMANLSFVRESEIPLPPIELQQKFASIVQKVEKLKEKQQESKKELDNLFNSLMQKAFKGII